MSTYGAASALVDASRLAHTVVVGARGVGATRGALLGSVSTQVASHAHCPVVVIHENQPSPSAEAPVVVGVDGSALSMNAIAYAFDAAATRRVGLTAVHAWWLDYVEGASASAIWTVDWENMAQEENAVVAESLAGWQEKYPDVEITRQSTHGQPVDAVVRQSENAMPRRRRVTRPWRFPRAAAGLGQPGRRPPRALPRGHRPRPAGPPAGRRRHGGAPPARAARSRAGLSMTGADLNRLVAPERPCAQGPSPLRRLPNGEQG